MILNGYAASAKVGESQNWQCLEFKLTAAAAGTAWSLLTGQSGASSKVKAMQGNGTAELLTSAQAQEICRPDSGVLSAEQTAIAADLVTYFTNVPAAADAAECLVACIGGVSGLGQVLCAELEWSSVGTSAANSSMKIRQSGPAVVATSSTSVTLGTDNVVAWPEANVLAIAFTISDVLDVPAAGAPVTLKVWVKP